VAAAFLLLHFSLGEPRERTIWAVDMACGGTMSGGTAPMRGVHKVVPSGRADLVAAENTAWAAMIGEVVDLDFWKLDSNR